MDLKLNKGTTLVELIIVLAILTLILGTVVGIFVSIMQKQQRFSSEDDISTQSNYVMDHISMLIQGAKQDNSGSCLGASYAGYNYLLSHFDATPGFYQGIKFISKDNDCYEIFLDTDGVLKETKGSNPAQNIFSSKYNIKYARFVINADKTIQGSSAIDSTQPRVTFNLDIATKGSQNPVEKIIQTTASQRNLNTP